MDMDDVHSLLDEAASSFHAHRGVEVAEKAAQFDAGIARAKAAIDEVLHHFNNVKGV